MAEGPQDTAAETGGQSAGRGKTDYSGGPKEGMKLRGDEPQPRSINKKIGVGVLAGVSVLAIYVAYIAMTEEGPSLGGKSNEEVVVADKPTLPGTGTSLPDDYDQLARETRARNAQRAAERARSQANEAIIPASLTPEANQAAIIPAAAPQAARTAIDPNDPRLQAARAAALQRLQARSAGMQASSAVRPAGLTQAAMTQGTQGPQPQRLDQIQFPPNFPPDETLQANDQAAKQAFAEGGRVQDAYLAQPVMEPISPYQVMAGNVLPATLITGLNSDLPGRLIAEIRHTVYDSVTGRHVLIPQGTRLLGEYSSSVTFGQNRALVIWNRMIYPNGRSIMLEGMPGVDISGYAGFKDKVDRHFFELMGSVLLGATVAVASEAAQDNDDDDFTNSILAGTATTSDQVIQQLVRRQLNVQPTIKIRPGYQFNVLVLADMVLPVYDPRPATPARGAW